MKHFLLRRFVYSVFLCVFSFMPFDGMSKPSYLLINMQNHERIIAERADVQRFPASLTKLMTIYIIFDLLKSGQLKLTDEIVMSRHACRMPPLKLYLRTGTKLTVEEAIRALIIRSANDVAVAVAEKISGSEYNFAAIMNAKANELGMHNTVFYNPSGLPHVKQLSTAEDMAILAEAHIRNHPEFYHYFGEQYFYFRKRRYKNLNSLIGKVENVDGLKTGFTPDAGRNLVASQKIGGDRVIGVVMGAKTSRMRECMMISLLNKQIPSGQQIIEAERRVSQKRGMRSMFWTIQMGSFKTYHHAVQFRKKHKTSLKDMASQLWNIVRRKNWYTTQVGKFQSKKEADQICKMFKGKSFHCLVVKTK